MENSINVALVTPDLHIGGAERVMVEMISAWQQQGLSIKPHVYSFRDGPIRNELEIIGCPVSISPFSNRLNPFVIFWLAKNFKKVKTQLLHVQLPRAGFYGRLAASILHLPVLYTEHSLWERHHPFSRLLNRYTYFINTHVAAVSNAVMSSIRRNSRYPESRLRCIYNGISPINDNMMRNQQDLRKNIGLPVDAIIIGTIANLNLRKGLKYFLNAVSLLVKELPNVSCAIIGRDDGEGLTLRQIAKELDIETHIFWLGYCSDARMLLPSFDIFVLPSLYEGLPITLIEAMDAGLPIVATNVGGNPELIIHEQTGLIVEPGNASELAKAIRLLVEDPIKSKKMAIAGQERMRTKFTVDIMARKYAELYMALVHNTLDGEES